MIPNEGEALGRGAGGRGGDGGREGTVGRGVGGREEEEGCKEILPGGAELIKCIDPK